MSDSTTYAEFKADRARRKAQRIDALTVRVAELEGALRLALEDCRIWEVTHTSPKAAAARRAAIEECCAKVRAMANDRPEVADVFHDAADAIAKLKDTP